MALTWPTARSCDSAPFRTARSPRRPSRDRALMARAPSEPVDPPWRRIARYPRVFRESESESRESVSREIFSRSLIRVLLAKELRYFSELPNSRARETPRVNFVLDENVRRNGTTSFPECAGCSYFVSAMSKWSLRYSAKLRQLIRVTRLTSMIINLESPRFRFLSTGM